jgi:cytochrome P450
MEEIFGPNYFHAGALSISKYDPEAKAKDSIDAKLTTYPQRKSERIGIWRVKDDMNYYYGSPDEQGRRKRLVSLFISTDGATQDPNLPEDQPDHTVIRTFMEENFIGEKHVKAIIERQTDAVDTKLLKEFGEEVKGLSTEDEITPIVSVFLRKFLLYMLFDVDLDKMPKDVEGAIDRIANGKFFLQLWFPLPIVGQKQCNKDVKRFVQYLMTDSKVLMNAKDGPNGLSKEELCNIIPTFFCVAAFVGISDISTRPMCRMPKGYAEEIVNDPSKLRNAILETARLDAPVGKSSQIVDDEEGLTTQIGKRTFTFKKGLPVFTSFKAANMDKKRFPNPFVFDPENRDFEGQLTSFNSIGEKTYDASPAICPVREVAIAAAANMIRAKIHAEARA